MNPEVVRYAGIEIMCMTKEIPDMSSNVRCENAFTYEFDKKYKYIFYNPPYGGDKNNTKAASQKISSLITFLNKKINDDEESDENKAKHKKQIATLKNKENFIKKIL